MNELELLEEADALARRYVAGVADQPVFPDAQALEALSAFAEPLPDEGKGALDTVQMLDRLGSPATVVSNGPNYFGFVIERHPAGRRCGRADVGCLGSMRLLL